MTLSQVEGQSPTFPVFFFSHGSTAMLGEQSAPAAYWEQVGRLAIAQGVERIIMMGAHWHPEGPHFQVATNPTPSKQPVAWVDPQKYQAFDPNIDVDFSRHVIHELQAANFDVKEAPKFEIIHDTFLILKWMFPRGRSLPLTIVSSNAFFDPHAHVRLGAALAHFRRQGCLIIGSGGAVHNLYRNDFAPGVFWRHTQAQTREPEQWALDFGQAFSDAVRYNSGPQLRKALIRLMYSPQYRDAHGTDDHYMPALFCAGAAGMPDDVGKQNYVGEECWELLNMRNTQYQLGQWPQQPHMTEVSPHAKQSITSTFM